MACKCGGSECTCVCTCTENYGVDCPLHADCKFCGFPSLQSVILSGAQNWCECFLSDSFTHSEPNQSLSNIREDATSSSGNFQDNELPLATVPLDSSHPNIELGSTHAQYHDTETSESCMSDTLDCRTSGDNKDEQMDYLKVIPSEETGLVVEETIGLVVEETLLNPSLAQSHTETGESSMPDISGCRPKGNNRTEQMGNLPTNQSSDETELYAEETENLSLSNILNDKISHNPVNSEKRVKYYRGILIENIKKENLAASNSRSETSNAEKNRSITQASNLSCGKSVSGSPQIPFTSVTGARSKLSASPFPDCSHDSTTSQTSMCVPAVSVHQKLESPSPVASGSSPKPPFYTDSATRLQSHFSESAQNKLGTKPAFSKSSNEPSIPTTPASEYARSKGIDPRESGNLMRPSGRISDWLEKMTTAPNTPPPQDDSTCSALSSTNSPSPVELVKDTTEPQNKAKSDKDTNVTEPQSDVVASDKSSSSFACSEVTAHRGSTCAEDTSPADSENKNIEQLKVVEESLESFVDAMSNLSTSLKEKFNIEETKLKESIQDSSKNS